MNYITFFLRFKINDNVNEYEPFKENGFLNRNLTIWIFLAMFLGISIGYFFPETPQFVDRFGVGSTNFPIAVGLILMMYPSLAKVNFAMLPKVFKNVRILPISLLLNWVIVPIVMFALAIIFLRDYPQYMIGVLPWFWCGMTCQKGAANMVLV